MRKYVLAQSVSIEGGLSLLSEQSTIYMPPYLLQYNLVITLTTLPQLPSVEFFKSWLISQLTVSARLGLGLTNSHHMSSLRTNKTSGVPGQLSSASN